MKFIRLLIDIVAYSLERARLKRFLRERGTSYAANHRDEWRRYGRDNRAHRYLETR